MTELGCFVAVAPDRVADRYSMFIYRVGGKWNLAELTIQCKAKGINSMSEFVFDPIISFYIAAGKNLQILVKRSTVKNNKFKTGSLRAMQLQQSSSQLLNSGLAT